MVVSTTFVGLGHAVADDGHLRAVAQVVAHHAARRDRAGAGGGVALEDQHGHVVRADPVRVGDRAVDLDALAAVDGVGGQDHLARVGAVGDAVARREDHAGRDQRAGAEHLVAAVEHRGGVRPGARQHRAAAVDGRGELVGAMPHGGAGIGFVNRHDLLGHGGVGQQQDTQDDGHDVSHTLGAVMRGGSPQLFRPHPVRPLAGTNGQRGSKECSRPEEDGV
jgi:hypothetical protein